MEIEKLLKDFVEDYKSMLEQLAESAKFKENQKALARFAGDIKTKIMTQSISQARIRKYKIPKKYYNGIFVEGIYFSGFAVKILHASQTYGHLTPGDGIKEVGTFDKGNAFISIQPARELNWKYYEGWSEDVHTNKSQYGVIRASLEEGDGYFISYQMLKKEGPTNALIAVKLSKSNDKGLRGYKKALSKSFFNLNDLGSGEIDLFLKHIGL